MKKTVKPVILFLVILSLVIIIRLLVFDIYKIPSSSMENLLYPGDVIVINKLEYGPRLPRSPFDIPWINIAFYFNDKAKKRIKEDWWDYKRVSGTSTIKQGDIFVFNSTWNKNYILVKRCVALPGDTLNIKNAAIYTNNKLFASPDTEKNNYKFKIKNKKKLYKALDSLALNDIMLNNCSGKFSEGNLSKFELDFLKKVNCINSIKIKIDTFVEGKTFVKTPEIKWTFDNMGPFVIPKKGMQIKLNPETFSLYERAINGSENCKIKELKGICFINNKKATTYTFKQDYYFMMGDNRKETLDSRAWGFVPESNIIGKVQCVLWSNYQGEFQWDRLFKNVK
ncbi:signal peptidase I [Flavobacterium daejeonense]|uniref:signal peptidase I n=1 Tax=Flavobacterium daejeonense TaxID=350893 RepID=UPI0012DC5885|nr:signal peptidase I [Flavobacterium daejeonense]